MKQNPKHTGDEDWKELAPTLFSLKKENPFEVPEAYFDKLSSQIIDSCLESRKPQTLTEKLIAFRASFRVVHTLTRPRVVLAMAACVLIAVVLIKRFDGAVDAKQEMPVGLAYHDMCNSPVLETIDVETLSDALAEQGFFDKQIPAAEQISDQDMEEYLLKNNIDASLISREL